MVCQIFVFEDFVIGLPFSHRWDIFFFIFVSLQAIEKHCRTENGYVAVKDVNHPGSPSDGVQHTFFLGGTLKYLYLLFSNDSLLPLDKWVFNTEAHPLPVDGAFGDRVSGLLKLAEMRKASPAPTEETLTRLVQSRRSVTPTRHGGQRDRRLPSPSKQQRSTLKSRGQRGGVRNYRSWSKVRGQSRKAPRGQNLKNLPRLLVGGKKRGYSNKAKNAVRQRMFRQSGSSANPGHSKTYSTHRKRTHSQPPPQESELAHQRISRQPLAKSSTSRKSGHHHFNPPIKQSVRQRNPPFTHTTRQRNFSKKRPARGHKVERRSAFNDNHNPGIRWKSTAHLQSSKLYIQIITTENLKILLHISPYCTKSPNQYENIPYHHLLHQPSILS